MIEIGGTGVSKSEVSRLCTQLDAEVATWRTRPLDDKAFPYVFLDPTYCKARINDRVVSQAVVIATGVCADGHREVLGCAVGDSETEEFWTEFLRDHAAVAWALSSWSSPMPTAASLLQAVRAPLDHVADTLATSHPRAAEMLREARADLTAFADFSPGCCVDPR